MDGIGSSTSRNDAPKTDFEKWMDAVRPAWRDWKRDEHPACSQAQIADMMCEAWNAGANTVEALRSEIGETDWKAEAERYRKGMLNWKMTAEAKDAQIADLMKQPAPPVKGRCAECGKEYECSDTHCAWVGSTPSAEGTLIPAGMPQLEASIADDAVQLARYIVKNMDVPQGSISDNVEYLAMMLEESWRQRATRSANVLSRDRVQAIAGEVVREHARHLCEALARPDDEGYSGANLVALMELFYQRVTADRTTAPE